MKKIIVLASLGTGLEYYDFVIYALLAGFIGPLFFPEFEHFTRLIATFGIFAVGYFARPFGGIVFGILGDKFGRKKVFSSSLLIMAITTFAMGVAPIFEKHRIVSAILFLFLRIIQGVSYGAELPIALTFLTEHSERKKRGKNCGLMVSSIGIGVMFGSFVVFVLTSFLSNAEVVAWGWRVPFILGGVLAIPAYFVRRHTEEPPCFKKIKHNENILSTLFNSYFKNIVLGLGIIIFPACLIVLLLSFPSYLQHIMKYNSSDIYLIITLGYIWSAILIPLLGYFSDYIGRKYLLMSSCVMFLCFGKFLFDILHYNSLFALVVFIFSIQTIISMAAASHFTMIAENFPTKLRCTGIAFCYNIAYVIAASTPSIFNYILKRFHNVSYAVYALMVVAVLTLVSAYLIKDSTRKQLN